MGDLDISLIKEFSRRPGFYDRSNQNFKDKIYNQQAWNEISHQLGYEAHLLKDRMYQLRNRYNLEKRRLENMRLEDPSNPVRSPWPLFYHLTFLDGHIRPRRSYKRMMRRRVDTDSLNDSEEMNNVKPGMVVANKSQLDNNMRHYQNGHADVKYETEADSDDDTKDDMETSNNQQNFIDPSNFLADDSEEASEEPTPPPTFASSLPQPGLLQPMSQRQLATPPSSHNNGISHPHPMVNVKSIEMLRRDLNTDDSNLQPPKKYPRKLSRYEKYEAFGRFLSFSLCDLDEDKALALVEKFTSDVVKALIEKK